MDIPDYSLYLVTDRPLCLGRKLIDVVKESVKGGVTLVQLREKNASSRDFLKIGFQLKDVLEKASIPLIINDRLDIALALDADGVHLGEHDIPLTIARKIMGHKKIIGVSASNVKEAIHAKNEGADYIGISPVFITPTKPELTKGLGLKGLKEMSENVDIPLIAIGGMNIHNCRSAIENGANGIAVVSAICSADDPAQAAKGFISEIQKGKNNIK